MGFIRTMCLGGKGSDEGTQQAPHERDTLIAFTAKTGIRFGGWTLLPLKTNTMAVEVLETIDDPLRDSRFEIPKPPLLTAVDGRINGFLIDWFVYPLVEAIFEAL